MEKNKNEKIEKWLGKNQKMPGKKIEKWQEKI